MSNSQELGTEKISRLIPKMAIPASIGILVMSIYFIVDTIFVGRWVGTIGIAAITVVMPITFLISSIGMALGVGSSSVISRALGADNNSKAYLAFGNAVSLTVILATSLVFICAYFSEPLLKTFGGNGDILAPAKSYFFILLIGVPCLAWAMMSNNIMRAEGEPKMAMLTMMIPAVANIILDPIFIIWLDMGLEGAAWATTISYYMSALFSLWYFLSGRSDLKFNWSYLRLKFSLIKEIASIGGVTLARQGSVSLFTLVINQSLYFYGGALAVAIYGVINRVMMFANFPVLGVTQGFLPISGYNYGAKKWARVRKTIKLSIRTGTAIAIFLFICIIVFAKPIVKLFSSDPALIEQTPSALTIVFLAMPLITTQLIGSAYFQAIGKAVPALLLTLTKQGFFLIPLILTLPLWFGLNGIWYSFPVADILAASVTYYFLRKEIKTNLEPQLAASVKDELAVI